MAVEYRRFCLRCRSPPHRKYLKESGREEVLVRKPADRMLYNVLLGAVNLGNQHCSAQLEDYRPRNCFWRQAFDQCVFLTLTNAYLLFCSWMKKCISDTDIALESLSKSGGGSLEGSPVRYGLGDYRNTTQRQSRALQVFRGHRQRQGLLDEKHECPSHVEVQTRG